VSSRIPSHTARIGRCAETRSSAVRDVKRSLKVAKVREHGTGGGTLLTSLPCRRTLTNTCSRRHTMRAWQRLTVTVFVCRGRRALTTLWRRRTVTQVASRCCMRSRSLRVGDPRMRSPSRRAPVAVRMRSFVHSRHVALVPRVSRGARRIPRRPPVRRRAPGESRGERVARRSPGLAVGSSRRDPSVWGGAREVPRWSRHDRRAVRTPCLASCCWDWRGRLAFAASRWPDGFGGELRASRHRVLR
jgi:hypothetical protein